MPYKSTFPSYSSYLNSTGNSGTTGKSLGQLPPWEREKITGLEGNKISVRSWHRSDADFTDHLLSEEAQN